MYSYEWPRMQVTVDIAITWRHSILLVQRKNEPFKGSWVLPGGFVEFRERFVHAAARELREETNISLAEHELEFINMFDAPNRDPRDRTVSALFHTHFGDKREHKPIARAGDDAKDFKWVDIYDIVDDQVYLGFDHNDMVRSVYNLKLCHD